MHLHANPFTSLKVKHVAAVFDSPGQFLDKVAAMEGTPHQTREMARDPEFFGGETWPVVAERAVSGDKDLAKRAAAIMSQIDAVHYATPKRQRVASPFGRVRTGNLLAGDPMPCVRKVKVAANHAPLSIVVSVNSSGNTPAAQLEARGVAIAALIRRLSAERPVSLYLSRFCVVGYGSDSANTAALVKFPTTPIDVYRLSYLLSSQGFARGAFFAFHTSARQIYKDAGMHCKSQVGSDAIGPAGGAQYSQQANCPYQRDLKAFFGHDVLYIPGAYSYLPDYQQMIDNPVGWVNATMDKLTRPKAA